MDGNPYSRILSVMRRQSGERSANGESENTGLGAVPAMMRLGTVTQRVPLKVRVAGIEQPTEALRVNERLTKGAKWKTRTSSAKSDYKALNGTLSGPVTCSGHGTPALSTVTTGEIHSKDTVIDEATVEQLEIDLEKGDQVLLLTADDQVFYIVMKVVPAV